VLHARRTPAPGFQRGGAGQRATGVDSCIVCLRRTAPCIRRTASRWPVCAKKACRFSLCAVARSGKDIDRDVVLERLARHGHPLDV